MKRFNPPPGWPLRPGWSPPPGWEPDATWPLAPEGWQFWTDVDSIELGHEDPPDEPGRTIPRTAVVLGSLAVMALTAAIAFVLMSGPASTPSAYEAPLDLPQSGMQSTTGAPSPSSVAEAAADADAHGFTVFHGGGRCFETDTAVMFMRTDRSALVVCSNDTGGLYYRGYRISDGASIDLYGVRREGGGFVAVNDPDDARYVITPAGFQLVQNGTVVTEERALESGPPGWDKASPPPPAQAPQTTTTVVLGSASAMGPQARGYGSEQPDVISMGSCANTIFDIDWHSWGADVAYGSGFACVQYGDSPRYEITASDPGSCAGIPAYRTLQIGTNPPQVICAE